MGNEVVPFKKKRDWQFYAEKISTAWQKATHSIIETGQCLIEAKAELDHGSFESMVQLKLPFDPRTAQRLMAIARNPVLTKATHVSVLPPSWGTLYELTKLPEETLRDKIADHTINPKMERKDARAVDADLIAKLFHPKLAGDICDIADVAQRMRIVSRRLVDRVIVKDEAA